MCVPKFSTRLVAWLVDTVRSKFTRVHVAVYKSNSGESRRFEVPAGQNLADTAGRWHGVTHIAV